MSWFQKLLPPKSSAASWARRAGRTCPRACGTSVRPARRCCTTPIWKKLQRLPQVQSSPPHHRAHPLDWLLDAEGRFEIGAEVQPLDTLKFKDSRKYSERLTVAQRETGETDAMVVMQGSVHSIPLVAACSNSASWAARWARWWASVSCAVCNSPPNRKCPSSASLPAARAHAGRPAVADADGQDLRALTQLSQERLPFISVLTDPPWAASPPASPSWRRGHRRTRRTDRLRRRARDPADGARNIAGRFSFSARSFCWSMGR